jgi:glucose-6-phosphate isomerase
MIPIEKLLSLFDPSTGEMAGVPATPRYLADLRGCFADTAAFESAAAKANPLVYSVASVEPGAGDGDLHYGVGMLMPGRISSEYFMTKGHFHRWREASEIYIGLRGDGLLLLEDEAGGESRLAPLRANHVVYVPGSTAHRTINIGSVPLTYIGIYPAKAGHDYAAIAASNFRCVVVERHGATELVRREDLQLP